jgi:recombination protein RecT
MSEQITPTATTAVAETKKPKTIRDHLGSEDFRKQVALALPKHVTAERFTRVALTALNRTPKLAECTQASLFSCLLDLSALGLEPDGRRAHLIPYGDKCTLIIDYKGLVDLVMRSGEVSNIHADVVCEEDEFEYNLGDIKEHKINFRKPRGEPYASYCIVTMKDGTKKAEVMSRDEIEGIRKRSRSGGSGPWVSDWNEMAKKTVFRRCSKWLPMSNELRDKLEKDDDLDVPLEIARPVFGGSVIDGKATEAKVEVMDSPFDELRKQCEAAGAQPADFLVWAVANGHIAPTVKTIDQIPLEKAMTLSRNFAKIPIGSNKDKA